MRRRTGWQRPRAGCCKLTGRVAPTRLQLSVTPSAFKVLLLYLLLSSLLFFSKFWREKLIRAKLFLPWNILFKSISPPLSTIDVFYGFFESDSPSPLFYDQRKLNCFKNEWLHESGCLTSIRCGVWNGAVGSGILQMLETRFFFHSATIWWNWCLWHFFLAPVHSLLGIRFSGGQFWHAIHVLWGDKKIPFYVEPLFAAKFSVNAFVSGVRTGLHERRNDVYLRLLQIAKYK